MTTSACRRPDGSTPKVGLSPSTRTDLPRTPRPFRCPHRTEWTSSPWTATGPSCAPDQPSPQLVPPRVDPESTTIANASESRSHPLHMHFKPLSLSDRGDG